MKLCTACDLCIKAHNQMSVILPTTDSKILILSDYPRNREDKIGITFNNPIYDRLFKDLESVIGVYKSDCMLNYLIRCKFNIQHSFSDVANKCLNYDEAFKSNYNKIKVIITLGRTVSDSIIGQSYYRTNTVYILPTTPNRIILPIEHPIYLYKPGNELKIDHFKIGIRLLKYYVGVI